MQLGEMNERGEEERQRGLDHISPRPALLPEEPGTSQRRLSARRRGGSHFVGRDRHADSDGIYHPHVSAPTGSVSTWTSGPGGVAPAHAGLAEQRETVSVAQPQGTNPVPPSQTCSQLTGPRGTSEASQLLSEPTRSKAHSEPSASARVRSEAVRSLWKNDVSQEVSGIKPALS